jgi:hypothetical protein
MVDAAAAAAAAPPAAAPTTARRRLLVILHGKRVEDELLRSALQELKAAGHNVCGGRGGGGATPRAKTQ